MCFSTLFVTETEPFLADLQLSCIKDQLAAAGEDLRPLSCPFLGLDPTRRDVNVDNPKAEFYFDIGLLKLWCQSAGK